MEKKIALFTPIIKSKGGKERVELSILENSRHKIDVFTFDYEADKTFKEFGKFKITDLKHHRFSQMGFFKRGLFLFFDSLFTKIDLHNYDILLISTSGIAEFIAIRNHAKINIALGHTPLRAAHEFYEYYKHKNWKYHLLMPIVVPIYRWIEKIAWKNIDYAIVLSDEVKERYRRNKIFVEDRIFKIKPSIDFSNIPVSNRAEKFFLYHSRFTPYKRQDLAIEAFKRSGLHKEGFKLVLSGFIEDKKYFESLRKMKNKYILLKPNLTNEEVKDLYRRCYATLFLAMNEDTGLAPLESLAYGKPVISVDEGGPREFIKTDYNGILVKADPTAIAHAMVRITDKNLYRSLVYGAKHSPKYTVDVAVNEFDRLIDILT